jgi:class 3 adenylate cyclase/KaiC/GvpD/RAD55 family RecA-like ATPase
MTSSETADEIDSRSERKLAAIMFTDIVGYTAMAQRNEALAVELLEEHRNILRPLFLKYGGEVIDAIGDGFLLEFGSALDAVRCSAEIQSTLKRLNLQRSDDRKIVLRIGIHLGDVIHKGHNVIGDAVNIASRIEPVAKPGGICVSQQVYDQVRNKVDFRIVAIGRRHLKNVEPPMEIYAVELPWEKPIVTNREGLDLQRKEISDSSKIQDGGVPSGIENLDEILGGGYPDKSTILVVSPPGIAKEVLGYWFTYSGLGHGDFCLYITRLPINDILRDAKAFGVDYSQKIPLWMASRGGQIKLELNDLASLSFNIKEILNKNGKRRVRIVTDVLSSLLLLNQPEVIYRFLSQLFDEIKQHDVILLATLEDGMHPSQVLTAIEHLFDGVVELKLFEEGLMRAQPLLRVLKMRGAQVEQSYFSFAFTRTGMEVIPFAK